MANENIGYTVTFKTRSEGTGAQQTTAAVRELRTATNELNAAQGDSSGVVSAQGQITDALANQGETVEQLKQREADLASARRMASDRRIADLQKEITTELRAGQAARDSALMRAAAGAALVASTRAIAQNTNDIIDQFKQLGVELTPAQKAFQETMDLLFSPIDTVQNWFTGYKDELKALQVAQQSAAKAEAERIETLKTKQAELRQATADRISATLTAEGAALDDQVVARERRLRVEKAITAAIEGRAMLEDNIALANGADPNQIAANQAARKAATRASDSEGLISDAEASLDDAIARRNSIVSALITASGSMDSTKEQINELSAQAGKADVAIEQAKLNLQAVRDEQAAVSSQIATETASAFLDVQQGAMKSLSTSAKETKTALEAEGREQGELLKTTAKEAMSEAGSAAGAGLKGEAEQQASALSATAREALKQLTEALKDGVIAPEEIAAVQQAIAQLKGSREQYDGAVQEGMREMIANVNTILLSQKSMNEEIRRQKIRAEGNYTGR